jgi:hypothetical protein
MTVTEDLVKTISLPTAAWSGIMTRPTTVGSHELAARPSGWTVAVWGVIQAPAISISTGWASVAVEVRLGDAYTGELVACGFANIKGTVTIVPHSPLPFITANKVAVLHVNLVPYGYVLCAAESSELLALPVTA